MADDHNAAFEVEQGIFEKTQSREVEIVCRLVYDDEISAAFQNFRKQESRSFSA